MRHQSSLWLSEGPKVNYLRTGLFKYHKNYTNKLYDKINPKQIVIKCIASEYFSKDFIELNCSFAHITLTFVLLMTVDHLLEGFYVCFLTHILPYNIE